MSASHRDSIPGAEKNVQVKSCLASVGEQSRHEFDIDNIDEEREIAPPAYNEIISRNRAPVARHTDRTPYYGDDRSWWEKFDECYEMSVLQQIISLVFLLLSISYIVFGVSYSGDCSKKKYEEDGTVSSEDSLTFFIQIEGGVLCATVLFIFLYRLRKLSRLRRTKRVFKPDIEGYKENSTKLYLLKIALYLVNFGLSIVGATKIFPLYDNLQANTNVTCDPEFYDFYHPAKIAQQTAFGFCAAFHFVFFIFIIPLERKHFIRRKLRQWARLLDADQDGIISQDDMKKPMKSWNVCINF